LADFICTAKLKSCHLISTQHGLVKESYAMRKAYQFWLLFTRNQVEEANKTVPKLVEWKMCGSKTITSATKHFSSKWSVNIMNQLQEN